MTNFKKLAIAAAITLTATSATAEPLKALTPIQAKGYILNSYGEKCWFKQAYEAGEKYYFYPKLTGHAVHLKFDDKECMSADDEGVEYRINVFNINNLISYVFTQPDAAFMTRVEDLRDGSTFQVRGQCIKSQTYSGLGVAVEYEIEHEFITSVRYKLTPGGCN